jgi:hypothetical protein
VGPVLLLTSEPFKRPDIPGVAERLQCKSVVFTVSLRMYTRLSRAHRAIPVVLGAVTLAWVGMLLAWDVFPGFFPPHAHDFLAAFPLAMIAFAYLLYQSAHRPAPMEVVKASILAAAFLFWAANQFWPNLRQATLFNDIAIGLFVLDVFLVMIGWPESSPDESFAETFSKPSRRSGSSV